MSSIIRLDLELEMVETDRIAIGQVMRNWPHVFSVLNLFGELAKPLALRVVAGAKLTCCR